MNKLHKGKWSLHREISGSPVEPDAEIGNDPAVNSVGYDECWLAISMEGGASPVVDLGIAFEVGDEWFLSDVWTAQSSNTIVKMSTAGAKFAVNILRVEGDPTEVTLRIMGSKRGI